AVDLRQPGTDATAAPRFSWRGGIAALAEECLDRLDDLQVAGATTEHASKAVQDLFPARRHLAIQGDLGRGHQHARRADAALRCSGFHEPFLQGAQPGVVLETFHGEHRASHRLTEGNDATAYLPAIEEHRA